MRLLSSLIFDIVCTVFSFLGMINISNTHRDDGCHSNTPMLHSRLISFEDGFVFVQERVRPAMVWFHTFFKFKGYRR
jgi:hypothetical protein